MWKYLKLFLVMATVCNGNFIEDPKCPAASPKSPRACKGQRSNCWSPGVKDTDCPGHGLCCYDGCANTCYADTKPSPSNNQPIRRPPPTTPKPIIPPPSKYIPQPPPANDFLPPPPVNNYIPPPQTTPPPTVPAYVPPPPAYVPPPAPLLSEPSNEIEIRQPPQPQHTSSTTCPRVSVSTPGQCAGRLSNCWSVGVPDLDCPNWGLCCFDGCANTCVGDIVPEQSQDFPRYEPTPPQPRRNPCDPNPCGPGSMCIPQEGKPQCKCPEGMIPNPTPEAGCIVPNPCDPNPCGHGSMCIPQEGRPFCKCPEGLVPDPTPEIKCSVRDPCNPSPCGPGTTCTANRDGNPICRCKPGLIPKPDTITGCGPECLIDPDCKYGFVCESQKCVEKPDPCNPSPCGPGTTCTPNANGNPICKCIDGLIPKPDTITGCGPECTIDPDCQYGYICSQQKCVEKPDPCVPNPCGTGAVCVLQGDSYSCECPSGTVGDGVTGCNRGECLIDDDCSQDKACEKFYCVDPCLSGTCRSTDFCRVMRHRPICGYNYDPPPQETRDTFVIGQRYNPPQQVEEKQVVIGGRHKPTPPLDSREPFVVGSRYQEEGPVRCSGGSNCGVPEDRMMMMMMDTSGLPVIGIARNKRNMNMRIRRRKKINI
eukprot:GFUD01016638.1.p1 GENE.GFUD01016638.1~~GFUD01016638.1.p1  ORF type:complete len:648 (-),score=103.17 GFUD01016638.1:526-2469(-)